METPIQNDTRARLGVVLLSVVVFASPAAPPSAWGETPRATVRTAAERDSRPPNILVILADDLGVHDLGVNGNELVKTPNIDRLISDSIGFTRFYTAGDVCAPTRASLVTGQYPQRFGFRGGLREIPSEVVTLPERLRELGYETQHIGKWHLGGSRPEARPEAHGYDGFFGFYDAKQLGRNGRPTYRDPILIRSGTPPRPHEGHLTEILTRESVEWIQSRSPTRPWFLNLWYFAPHAPYQPPERWRARFAGQPHGAQLALISALDEGVGHVLAALEASGQSSDTIVFFLSDNGAVDPRSNAPYFGAKSLFFEGGIRVPLAVRMPGHPAPRVVPDVVSSLDLAQTLVELAGARAEPGPTWARDGRSITPLLTGGGSDTRERELFWESIGFSTRGMRSFSARPRVEAPPTLTPGLDWSVLSADGRWRLAKERAEIALFDLESDPTGTHNVVRSHPERVAAMTQRYREWSREVAIVPFRVEPRDGGTWDGDHADLRAGGRVDLVGYDFERTPGQAGWSFALGVAPDRLAGATGIARQGDVWSLHLSRSGHVEVALGGEALTGPALRAAACTPIAVTARFRANTGRTSLRLYVDGEDVGSTQANVGPTRSPEIPTSLGVADAGGEAFRGRLYRPAIWNRDLRLEEIAELSTGLCPASSTPPNDPR